tara:strand:- start:6354 stop:7487 length:1134 start_codon:yes stop_codon:yes gene_type:complete
MKYKFAFFIVILVLLSACSALRPLSFGAIPSQKSYKHFPSRIIENSDSVFNFIQPIKDYQLGEKIGMLSSDFNATNIKLDSFVKTHKTISFLIIRNDTILYENYQKDYNRETELSSFSVAKPIVSTLIGILIDEGRIKSINDPITNYIPEFADKEGFNKITIKNLLHHTSGIKFSEGKLALSSDNSQFFWGKDLRKRMLNPTIETAPNEFFHYSSENTLLLAYIIEKITGGTISNYLEQKIWKPLGMEAPANWSLDRDDDQAIEKAFCCLQARPIDFAKFARLYLNKGNWEGQQIISKKWVDYSTHPDPEGNNKHFYNNNWGIGPLKYGSFYAIGLYGQYLYVYPEKNIIIVRFGDSTTYLHTAYWNENFIQIIDQI